MATDNCGTHWNESSAYDPFGNVTKSGSFPWPSGGYSQLTNRYASTAFTYDANGRLTNDSFDALGWDVFGNLVAQSGTNIVYDAQDRTFSTASGSALTVYLYSPDGALVGTANDSTHTVQQMFVPLPNSRAVYVGGVLSYFDHYDWQGSARVSSTWARGVYSDVSYDAFGMPYWTAGASNNQYAGLTSDFSSGTELASESRRYHPSQGRWESPDDRVPDVYDPQSFNAYAYVNNLPSGVTDPSGHEPYLNGDGYTIADANPDSGILTFYFGNIVDPNDYLGYYGTYDAGSQTINLLFKDEVTNTPYQEPIVIPGNSGEPTLGIPPTQPQVFYPSQMSSNELNQLDRQMTGLNMVTTLSGAFVGGLTSGISSVSGAGFQSTGFTSVGPALRSAAIYPEGTFSIIDWRRYPAGVPRPEGPFRLLEGQEYNSARSAANTANQALRQADPTAYRGMQIHEIQPVKFGGSPTSMANKVALSPTTHYQVTSWWNAFMRSMNAAP